MGLIAGAVWIGLASEPDEVVVFIADGRYSTQPARLDCSQDDFIYAGKGVQAQGEPGSPTPYYAAIEALVGLRSGDLILRRVTEVLVERNDRTVAIAFISKAAGGSWVVTALSSCGRARITLGQSDE
jgi:hypothetical protein